jgi:hypothetical protein
VVRAHPTVPAKSIHCLRSRQGWPSGVTAPVTIPEKLPASAPPTGPFPVGSDCPYDGTRRLVAGGCDGISIAPAFVTAAAVTIPAPRLLCKFMPASKSLKRMTAFCPKDVNPAKILLA